MFFSKIKIIFTRNEMKSKKTAEVKKYWNIFVDVGIGNMSFSWDSQLSTTQLWTTKLLILFYAQQYSVVKKFLQKVNKLIMRS